MIDGIEITGRIKRENGKWQMQISGPSWALIDFSHEMRDGNVYLMLTNGPTSSSVTATETMLFSEWNVDDWYVSKSIDETPDSVAKGKS